jgi:hypothetical protein
MTELKKLVTFSDHSPEKISCELYGEGVCSQLEKLELQYELICGSGLAKKHDARIVTSA